MPSKYKLSKLDCELAELFYENIKIRRSDVEINKGIDKDFVKQLLIHQQLKLRAHLSKQICETVKDFGTMPKYILPNRIKKHSLNLVNIIRKRRSIRKFSGENLTILELSTLLQGYKASSKKDKILGIRLRNIPSAGALYPLEVYFTLIKSANSVLPAGVYHYEPNGHYATCISKKPEVEKIVSFISQPEISIRKSAAIFYITGIMERASWKYGNRCFNYMLIEAGHLAQNLCLLARSMDLAICPIGGFIDDEVSEYLKLDASKEITLYILVVGKLKHWNSRDGK